MEAPINFENAVKRLQSNLTPHALSKIGNMFTFNFKDTNETFIIDAENEQSKGWLKGTPESHGLTSNFFITISQPDFAKLVFGQLNPMARMVSGRMKLKGNIKESLKLDRLLRE